MTETLIPTIASMIIGQGGVDSPCSYSSVSARASFLRMSENAGLEKALSAQALDLATAKSELIDLEPIGMTNYEVRIARYKDKLTGETVEKKTLVSPDFNGEPIGVWTDAGEYGGTKEEYQRVVGRANELAEKKGDAAMFWVSPGKEDSKNPLPHRAYLWVKKGDEVTAYSYSLSGSRKTLEGMMEKLGGGKLDKPLEDQTIISEADAFSHARIFAAFSSSLSPNEAARSKDFLERFEAEARLPDEVRRERLRIYKETYEKELRQRYESELRKILPDVVQGFFHVVAKTFGEKTKVQTPSPVVLNGQQDYHEQVHHKKIKYQEQEKETESQRSASRYKVKFQERSMVLTQRKKDLPDPYKEALEAAAIPLLLAISKVEDEVKFVETKKPEKEKRELKVVKAREYNKREYNNSNDNDDQEDDSLIIEETLQNLAQKLFITPRVITDRMVAVFYSSKQINQSENGHGLIQEDNFVTVSDSSFPVVSEEAEFVTQKEKENQNLSVKRSKRLFPLFFDFETKEADRKVSVDRSGEMFEILADLFGDEMSNPTIEEIKITEEIKIRDEIINLGKELFRVLYTKRINIFEPKKNLDSIHSPESYNDSLLRLGIFLTAYFDEETPFSIKELLSLFVFKEIEAIMSDEPSDDSPELIYLRKYFENLSFKVLEEKSFEVIFNKMRFLFEEKSSLSPIVLHVLRIVLEKDGYTFEKLRTLAAVIFRQFGQKLKAKLFPRRGIIYQYALLVNKSHFVTQYN